MKIFGITVISTLMFLVAGICNAQESLTTMDSLMSRIWKHMNLISGDREDNNNDVISAYTVFTEKERVTKTISPVEAEKPLVDHSVYYLSDSVVTRKFDESKIGKVRNGRYIVYRNYEGKEARPNSVKIVKMNNEELVLTRMTAPKVIRIGAKNTWKYYAVDEDINFDLGTQYYK